MRTCARLHPRCEMFSRDEAMAYIAKNVNGVNTAPVSPTFITSNRDIRTGIKAIITFDESIEELAAAAQSELKGASRHAAENCERAAFDNFQRNVRAFREKKGGLE